MENLATEQETPDKRVRKRATIPQTQYDLLNTAQSVLVKWKTMPKITLQWVNVEEYANLVEELSTHIEQRTAVGSKRSSQTQNLALLDRDINSAVEQVKIAIYNKFGKNTGKAYLASFGIVKYSGNSYKLPQDRNQRLNALPIFAKSCEEHDIETIDYKKDFFQGIFKTYQDAVNIAQVTDSSVTISVGNKNDVSQKLKEVLQAIILLIKANYPNTYQNELRGWGFQKEKY
jgi:hypothetical protein